jgi:hypothetical protein
MLLMSVQPPISTIPCKIVYSLANPMLLFPMFVTLSLEASASSPELRPPASLPRATTGHFANRSLLIRAIGASALSSPDVRPFNLKLPAACPVNPERRRERNRRGNFLSLSPFPATLTDDLQLTENATTLSPFAATLTSRVKHNPFVCHSYRKHPGWGYPLQFRFFSLRSLTALRSLLVYPEASRRATISFAICTSAKRARNPRRIHTSKTQRLKPFRIRTYGKTRGGGA